MLQQSTDSPTAAQVNSYLKRSNPECPASGDPYDLSTVPPVCPAVASYPEHKLGN